MKRREKERKEERKQKIENRKVCTCQHRTTLLLRLLVMVAHDALLGGLEGRGGGRQPKERQPQAPQGVVEVDAIITTILVPHAQQAL